MEPLGMTLLLGLAAYRATQFVVWDTLLDGPRERLELWHAAKHESKVRTFVRQLVSCIYCIGFWLSTVTVLAYTTATHQWGTTSPWLVAIQCWAVAGVQALLNRWDDSRPAQGGGGS